MSHAEKPASAVVSPTAEVPSLTKNAKMGSEKSSAEDVVEHGGLADSQDEVNAFARRDVSWTEAEESSLVWRLGALKTRFLARWPAWGAS
jgi:hypothetical protein